MRDDQLIDFQGTTRLFPLSGVVLFPHAVMPLHIFEPRYRQLMADALLGDKFITIVQPRFPLINTATGPVLEPIGCLGRIIQHERLDDGRYNLLLAGLKRVRLTDELRTPGKLYREAHVDLLEDLNAQDVPQAEIKAMSSHFLKILDNAGCDNPGTRDLLKLCQKSTDAGMMTDLIAQALGLPPMVRQAILNELQVPSRVDQILNILRMILKNQKPEPAENHDFPPKFSQN